jgi:hypothetical protein
MLRSGGNQILRLEVRDFKGEAGDYSKGGSLFSKPDDLKKTNDISHEIRLPWYRDLFVILYFVDLIALLYFFLPYLRTYFRLETQPVNDCAIPIAIESGKKVKVGNSVIYWDKENRAIWLRPRGFNLFQVPLMAAKLNTDRFDKTITSQEIRFSSGFPFIMALFFWTAYQLFSLVMPANIKGLSAAGFVGVVVLMFIISSLLNYRRQASRMERLIQDALSELRRM